MPFNPDTAEKIPEPATTAPEIHRAMSSRDSNTPVHSLDEKTAPEPSTMKSLPRKLMAGVLLVLVVAGVGTGMAAANFLPGGPSLEDKLSQVQREEEISDNQIKNGAIFGIPDEKTFRDSAEGVIIRGGLEGEGSHTLLREGDASQNVYLTSSVVDLDQFENMSVTVWGETFKGQKAGWLMDVGRVEVINTSGSKPAWYEEE